ncbi:hypothetical protein F5877DRAFT_85591 [Lentinula edodes]|nr:hypothetical protein F5877DRAFT_85591 [Lentinula edodes]
MPKSGKRLKKVRSHPYDKDSEETAPPRFNGAFDFSADAPYNNFLLRTEAAIPKPIAPIPDHGRALDKRSERARKRFGPILDALQHELLQFYTDKTFEEHQNVRKSYLRARTLGQTEEYLADVRRRSRLVFGRKSPNPFSTRILSSDGQTLLVYLAFRAPPEILQVNKQQNKSQALRKKAKASDQPVMKDLDSSNKSTRVYFHGMPEDVRSRYHQATQMLLAFVPPEKPKESSRRHGGLDPTKQASYYTTHRGWDAVGLKEVILRR